MDTVADMISQLKNTARSGKSQVAVSFSTFRRRIAEALMRAGYIASVEEGTRRGKPVLEIELAYGSDGQPKLNEIRRISKLSRRMYKSVRDIRPVRQGYGDVIVSTPKGVLTGKEARRERAGGEILFEIW